MAWVKRYRPAERAEWAALEGQRRMPIPVFQVNLLLLLSPVVVIQILKITIAFDSPWDDQVRYLAILCSVFAGGWLLIVIVDLIMMTIWERSRAQITKAHPGAATFPLRTTVGLALGIQKIFGREDALRRLSLRVPGTAVLVSDTYLSFWAGAASMREVVRIPRADIGSYRIDRAFDVHYRYPALTLVVKLNGTDIDLPLVIRKRTPIGYRAIKGRDLETTMAPLLTNVPRIETSEVA